MACSFNIKTNFLPDASSGGQWELVGFSLTENGTYGTGGNWPWLTNAQEDPSVNFDNIQQGFYKLNYFVSGSCGGAQEVVIPVIGGGDAGMTETIDTCTTSGIINITDELGTIFDGGVLEPSYNFTGSGFTSAGFNQPNPNTPIGATFDPSQVAAGTYVITLTITPSTPSGYSLAPCCLPTSAALIVNVSEASIEIEIDDSCHINLVSTTGCTNATFELHKSVNGGAYVPTGISNLPYQAQEDADWKLVGTGCDCGTVDSNIVDSTGCCDNSALSMYFDADFCAFFINGSLGCSGGTIKWYRSCDGQQTWEHQPQHDGATFFFVNDDCCYQAIKDCPNGCNNYSNVDCASGCAGGCNGALGGTSLPCKYRVSSGTYCTGGTLKLIKTGVGVVSSVALTGANTYPIDFDITSDGSYYASLACNDGCPDYVGPTFTYTGCGGGNDCNSVLTTSVVGCTITANVTNCPSPVYTFLKPDGSVAYSGPNNSYTGDVDGTWSITASGCPNCPTLNSTETLAGCGGNTCNCSATITETPCANFTLNPQSCTGYTIQWQFRTGAGQAWNNVGSGGLTYQGSQNGQYRAVLSKAGCPNENTNIITITCFGTGCDCTPTITVDQNDCEIEWTLSGCTGFTTIMQFLGSGGWVDISTNPSSPYTPSSNGTYRLKFTKANCNTVFSDPIEITCVGGGCQVVISAMNVDPNNCNNVIVAWTGAGGDNVTVQWTKATANTANCDNASGWQVLTGASNTVPNADGTGFSNIVLGPDDCNTCIRAIINANGEGCGQTVGKVYAPCCCNDTPTISEQGIDVTYDLRVYDQAGVQDRYDEEGVQNQSYPRALGIVKVFRDNVEIESTPFSVNCTTINIRRLVSTGFTQPTPVTGDYYETIQFGKSTDDSLFTIPLAPTTATLTGVAGTVASNDLILDTNDPSIQQDALDKVIRNHVGTLNLYTNLQVAISQTVKMSFRTECRHNANDNYCGLQDGAMAMSWNSQGTSLSVNGLGGIRSGEQILLSSNAASCGGLATNLLVATSNITISGSSHNFVNVTTPNAAATYNNAPDPISRVCSEHELTVSGECTGATYLWSTGETTETITVASGDYSVVVSCPDGCTYTLNITV